MTSTAGRSILPLLALLGSVCGLHASTIIAPADDPAITAQLYRDEAFICG